MIRHIDSWAATAALYGLTVLAVLWSWGGQ